MRNNYDECNTLDDEEERSEERGGVEVGRESQLVLSQSERAHQSSSRGPPFGLYVWLAWHRLRIDPVPESIILLAGKTMHDLTDQSHNSPTTVTRGWSILFLLLFPAAG